MNFSISRTSAATAAFLLAVLCGCGGGGSSSGSTDDASTGTAVKAFPMKKAITNLYSTGYQKTVSVNGTASIAGSSFPFSGTMQISDTPTGTTFNGQSAIDNTLAVTGTLSIDKLSYTIDTTIQSYLNLDYSLIGTSSSGSYCVAQTAGQYPSSVTIGQSGLVASVSCYTDSTQTTSLGTETVNYVVSASTATDTANVTMTSTVSSADGLVVYSIQSTYQIDTSGNITYASTTISETIDGISLTFTLQ